MYCATRPYCASPESKARAPFIAPISELERINSASWAHESTANIMPKAESTNPEYEQRFP